MRLVFLLGLLFSCSKFPEIKAPAKESKFFRVGWSKNLEPEYTSGNLAISPTGAPRIFNDILYMGSPAGVMRAYDIESGRVLWEKDEKTTFLAPSEFFSDHIAYGGLSGRLFVRQYMTGELKYAIDLGAPIESAPVYFNGHLLLYLRGHQIVHLDAETGKILWVYKRAVPVTTTLQRTTKPLILGSKIIVGFADGYVGALSLQEGLLLWETRLAENSKFVDIDLNPLMVNDLIVTGSPSGDLKAVNPENGAISRSYPVSVMSHPMLRNEQLLLGTNEGEVILMSFNGEILKRVKVSDQPVSALGWWRDHIVAASFDGYLRAIDPLTMKVIDHFALGYDFSAVYSDLVVHGEFLSLFTSRNNLYVFQ